MSEPNLTNLANLVSLKEYIETKFIALERATELARMGMEGRLEGMNEFRDTLKDQATKFVTRDELKFMADDIRILRESRAELSGKASQLSVNVTLLIAILSLVLGFAKYFK